MELKKRISDEVEKLLNERIKNEYISAHIYWNIANWCNCYGFYKAKDKFRAYGDEELKHARKLEDYMNDRNGNVTGFIIPDTGKPYKSLLDVLMKSYEHEISITEGYKNLSISLLGVKDMVTYEFIQWYIGEQIEEEAKFGDVLVTANRLGITDECTGIELLKLEELI